MRQCDAPINPSLYRLISFVFAENLQKKSAPTTDYQSRFTDKFMSKPESVTVISSDNSPAGFWRKIVAFLYRDIGSFLPAREVPTPKPQDQPPTLIDPGKLKCLAYRRDVLDWRDGFHADVMLTMSNLYCQFVSRIDLELDNLSIIDKFFPRPAHEVLVGTFIQSVWVPFYSWITLENGKLSSRASKWGLQQLDMAFNIKISDAEHYSLGDISFKRINREQIIFRLEAMMLGSDGIAGAYCAQATYIASQLINKKRLPC
ncbi:MAG: hypothetical protein L6Q40_13150 [Azonexus sp.]|nr:hypothetical protein [Azonexus sp.]